MRSCRFARRRQSPACFQERKRRANRPPRTPTPAAFKSVAKSLRRAFGTNVRVKTVKGKNKIEIEFKDEEDLERIFKEMTSSNDL